MAVNPGYSTSPQLLITGAFDDLRSSHIRFLEEAARFGEVTALVWSDDLVRQRTGSAPRFPERERLYLLQGIRYVSYAAIFSGDAGELGAFNATAVRRIVAVRESELSAVKEFPELSGSEFRVIQDEKLRSFPAGQPQPPPSVSTRKKVVVTGCFDWLHSGHLRFFEEASGCGDLYVIVGHDENIRLQKGEGHPMFPQAERSYVVASVRYVVQAVVSTGAGWLDGEPEIQRIQPDVFVVNEDGNRPIKREYCARHGIQYVVLKRTPAAGLPKRSSTELRGARPFLEA